MTAEKAKLRAEQIQISKATQKLDQLHKQIADAADDGAMSIQVQVGCPSFGGNTLVLVRRMLEGEGYKVEVVGDQRDGDYLDIQWWHEIAGEV